MIRVLIADDHGLVRDALTRMLSTFSEIEVVGGVSNGEQAIERAAVGDVDVLLLDVSMPGPGFVPVLERIAAMPSPPRVLIVTGHPEERFARRAFRAGAAGYFTKDQSVDELAAAVRQVYRGRPYLTNALAEILALDVAGQGVREDPHDELSNREFEVLTLLGEGRAPGEIGELLGVSAKTVSTYRARILEKLCLGSTAELIRYAVERQLVR